MGLFIKDMQKPKNCGECPLMRGSYCAITDNFYFEEADYDPTSCPLEEIDLVRCKECKNSKSYTMNSNLPISRWCHRFSAPVAVEDDDYCSYAERRNDE